MHFIRTILFIIFLFHVELFNFESAHAADGERGEAAKTVISHLAKGPVLDYWTEKSRIAVLNSESVLSALLDEIDPLLILDAIQPQLLETIRAEYTSNELVLFAQLLQNSGFQKMLTGFELANLENPESKLEFDQQREIIRGLSDDEKKDLEKLFKNFESSDQLSRILDKKRIKIFYSRFVTLFLDRFVQQIAINKETLATKSSKDLSSSAIHAECHLHKGKTASTRSRMSCGVSHYLGDTLSSKIYAELLWKGSVTPQDIDKAIEIYKTLIESEHDLESIFFYGALGFNRESSTHRKKIASCWLYKAASAGHSRALSFVADIKTEYGNPANQCKYL